MDWTTMAVGWALGCLSGAIGAWWWARVRALHENIPLQIELAQLYERVRLSEQAHQAAAAQCEQLRSQGQVWRNDLDSARDECAQLAERSHRVPALEAEISLLTHKLEELNSSYHLALTQRAEIQVHLEAERHNSQEKLALLTQAKQALSDQFKTLANDILEEKSTRFAQQNQLSMGQLLEPLQTRLASFQTKVEEVYVQEGKDRSALSEQVRQLVQLNQALSQDAKNLTQALSGSVKTQGNWGELILERVLEASGLRKHTDYTIQPSHQREDGSRAQPDVVIHLPEDRHLVVDAKVSLVAYERTVSASNEEARVLGLKQHLDSVRTHIRGLSDKKYEAIYGLKSLDFVLMFIPIEPAFMLAVTQDNELFMDAWQRNVLVVSPSTLLFVVRTVAHLWRQEAQSRNTQEIAKRGADLYDKLCSFVEDLQGVGQKLGQAKVAFDNAQKKLSTGKGNLIRQAQNLKELGVKPSKALPADIVELTASDEEEAAQQAVQDPMITIT